MATGERVGTAVADRIRAVLVAEDSTVTRLSRLAGIPQVTLARKLRHAPESFTLQELAMIADALHVRFEDLVYSPAELMATS